MVSSAVRPLAVARGGLFSHDTEPGTEQSDGEVLPFRHQSPRRAVAPESQKLYDALSEKALRCAVGSHLGMDRKDQHALLPPYKRSRAACKLRGEQALAVSP